MKNAAILHLSPLCLQPAAQAQGSGTRFRHYADGRCFCDFPGLVGFRQAFVFTDCLRGSLGIAVLPVIQFLHRQLIIPCFRDGVQPVVTYELPYEFPDDTP